MHRTPALIVGGGPAGAAAAIVLARGGIPTEVIERRHTIQPVVCGGFLGWDALAALKRLGIDAANLGARPIDHMRLVAGRRLVEIRLPRPAAGLSRRSLDAALLDHAKMLGAYVRYGRAARGINMAARTIRLDDGAIMRADALFLATGKHDLRGAARPRPARAMVGLRVQLPPSPRLGAELCGVVELHLFDDGYAGLLVQEDDSINLCISIRTTRLGRAGGIEAMLAALGREQPLLGERLTGAPRAKWATVAGVPHGWRARGGEPGVFRLGDQAAVIPSLVGDGIAMALNSGMAAAHAVMGKEETPHFQSRFAAISAMPLRIAGMLQWAAEHRGTRTMALHMFDHLPATARLAARLTHMEPWI